LAFFTKIQWVFVAWIFTPLYFLSAQTIAVPKPLKSLHQFHEFSDTTVQKIEGFFDRFAKIGNFNGAYLMFKNDSVIYGSRGYAIYSNKDSIEPENLFQLASVSKVFTALAVMILHQDAYLNIDDSVHWYLPELNNNELTIRELLSHTSGLPDYFYVDYKGFILPQGQGHLTNQDVVEIINRQSRKTYSKKGFYHYSNTNYVLLSLIVERVSKMDFRSFVREHIAKYADMPFTHVCDFDSVPLLNYPVQGYNQWNVFEDVSFNGTTGDKGVYSNVFEMLNLDRALRGSYLLHENIKEEMWTPQTLTSPNSFYALGWRVKWIDEKKWIFHNGWWKGFRTYFWRCLDEDKCFVVLTNNVQGRFLSTLELVSLLD
jgi:CubicO group peptidase (beta-lactamase class C family)